MRPCQGLVESSILSGRTDEKTLVSGVFFICAARAKHLYALRRELNAGAMFWLFLMPKQVRRVPRHQLDCERSEKI